MAVLVLAGAAQAVGPTPGAAQEPARSAPTRPGRQADADGVDRLVLRFWEHTHQGARAGERCLEDTDLDACEAMTRHFGIADSVAARARELDPDTRVSGTGGPVPIAEAAASLLELSDSVRASLPHRPADDTRTLILLTDCRLISLQAWGALKRLGAR